MRCATCTFWNVDQRLARAPITEVGECRRFPPVRRPGPLSEWPLVSAEDWCGEHRSGPRVSDPKRR